MTARLVVHLGPHKTATSSLQWWLTHSEPALASSGIRVGRSGRNDLGHHDLALSLLRPSAADSSGEGRLAPWRSLRTELDEADGAGSVVVSSENLAQLGDRELDEIATLLGDVDVTVLAGVRDPAVLVPSHWQETVKWSRQWSLAEAAVELLDDDAIRLVPLLDRWRVLGRTSDVALFVVPGRRGGATVADNFAAALGVAASTQSIPSDLNRSLSYAHVEAIRAVSIAVDPNDAPDTVAERQELTLRLARLVDVDPQGRRPSLPPRLVGVAAARRDHLVRTIGERGFPLAGDPDALEAPAAEHVAPQPAEVAAVLDVLWDRIDDGEARRHIDRARRACTGDGAGPR